MPSFTYTGDDTRQFPADDGVNNSVEVAPGDVIDNDHNPDPNYFDPVKGKPQQSKQSEE